MTYRLILIPVYRIPIFQRALVFLLVLLMVFILDIEPYFHNWCLIAKKIIEIAIQHNVPVIDNAPVARALFRMVDINQQIPPELYKAVAEILLFVYGLKNNQNQGNIK